MFFTITLTKILFSVDGGYSKWSVWTTCTKSCGGGIISRSRTCTVPEPQFGGKDCSLLGKADETKACNEHVCPSESHQFSISLPLCI